MDDDKNNLKFSLGKKMATQIKIEREEILKNRRNTFNNNQNEDNQNKYNRYKSNFSYPSNILNVKNITTKKEWIKWLLNNHVDKGGECEECTYIISAGRDKGW